MAALPPLHVRQQLLHQPRQAEEVCVKELLHGSDALALQRSDHANTSIVHCNGRESCVIIGDIFNSLYRSVCEDVNERRQTEDIHSSVGQAVDTLSDGLFTTGI